MFCFVFFHPVGPDCIEMDIFLYAVYVWGLEILLNFCYHPSAKNFVQELALFPPTVQSRVVCKYAT